MEEEEKKSVDKEEKDDLNLNFIKENDNEDNHSKSSIKEKAEDIKLFDNSEISNNSQDKKNDSINLLKKSSKSSSKKNLSSQRYSSNKIVNEKEEKKNNKEEKEEKNENNGKFMQINPHFNIFNKQISSLRDSIYDDTKRCLILKGSLQESSNYLKKESNGLIKDIVEQIYNLRELFEKGNKGLNQTTNEVNEGLKKLKEIQSRARKEIIECDKRISKCENQIGYKLLGNPSYSFLKEKKIKTVIK